MIENIAEKIALTCKGRFVDWSRSPIRGDFIDHGIVNDDMVFPRHYEASLVISARVNSFSGKDLEERLRERAAAVILNEIYGSFVWKLRRIDAFINQRDIDSARYRVGELIEEMRVGL